MTSYQADFASHRTFDRHVGFLSAWRGIIRKHKKMPQNFLFSSYHNTKLQLSDKNISTHAHSHEIFILNPTKQRGLLFFSIPRNTKRKPRSGEKLCVHLGAFRYV